MTRTTAGYADLGNGKVYYETAGEGEPLVLLHAGIVDSGMWDDQWSEFSRHCTVIRYDMPGFGRSDAAEKPVSRRQELYQVLDQVGAARATLVGCSLSGETILDVALERPEVVAGLVVVSATPPGFEMHGEPPPHLMEMLAAVEQGDLDLASELQMRVSFDGMFRQPAQVDRRARERAAAMNRHALGTGGWAMAMAPSPDPLTPPTVQRLDQIQAPALIMAGALDHPELVRAAEVMAAAIPGAQKVIVPDAAHLLNMEQPAAFNQAVLDFLRVTA